VQARAKPGQIPAAVDLCLPVNTWDRWYETGGSGHSDPDSLRITQEIGTKSLSLKILHFPVS
jgi:hypothetical protein